MSVHDLVRLDAKTWVNPDDVSRVQLDEQLEGHVCVLVWSTSTASCIWAGPFVPIADGEAELLRVLALLGTER